MALTGKLVRQVEIKSGGDVFHELFRFNPHNISTITPGKVHGCNLHQGDWGSVGSIISWSYTQGGKKMISKQIIGPIDEEKKLITFKCIEGDLMELYKTFIITCHVDTIGNNNLVTWTYDYEKKNANVEDPTTLANLLEAITKDIETHHLK